MKNYWYIARENELLLDCDKGFNRKDAEHICRIFEREISENRFHVYMINQHLSATPGHLHVLITMENTKLFPSEKMALSVMLGSDRHREILAYTQLLKNFSNPYLLVSSTLWAFRKPDHICSHKNWRKCPCLRKIQHPPIGDLK